MNNQKTSLWSIILIAGVLFSFFFAFVFINTNDVFGAPGKQLTDNVEIKTP